MQKFQVQESERELLSQKLSVFAAMAAAGDNKQLINQLLDTWNKLVALTYGSELANVKPLTENYMFEEYEKFRNTRPKFKITKRGLQVEGLEIQPTQKTKKK